VASVTAVGYGDLHIATDLGSFTTTIMILSGFAIIPIPPGIVTPDVVRGEHDESTEGYPSCGVHRYLTGATDCRRYGRSLSGTQATSKVSLPD
jgi:voltage-gated potassium channel